MRKFRFEDLEIWKEAISLASVLFRIADQLELRHLWRFADQTRGVALSIPNNIAESTGTNMKGEQTQLLRYSKRECYEAANITFMLKMESLISIEQFEELHERLDILSRKIQSYSDSL